MDKKLLDLVDPDRGAGREALGGSWLQQQTLKIQHFSENLTDHNVIITFTTISHVCWCLKMLSIGQIGAQEERISTFKH